MPHRFPCSAIREDALSFDLRVPTTQGCDRTGWHGRLAGCAGPLGVTGAHGHTCTQGCTHMRIPAYTCAHTQVGVGPLPCLSPWVPVCTHIGLCISSQAQLHGGFGLPGAWRYSQGEPILWLLGGKRKAGLLLRPPGNASPQCPPHPCAPVPLCLAPSEFPFLLATTGFSSWLGRASGRGEGGGGAGGALVSGPTRFHASHWARLRRCPAVFSLETASLDCCY